MNDNLLTVTFTLSKDLIFEAVKADTFITGQTTKAADGSNTAQVYNVQAGDETYHERKLFRTLRGALGTLESNMADFVDSSEQASAISDTLDENSSTFDIVFTTSSRFKRGLANAISQMAQEFLINQMLVLWWVTSNQNLATTYKTLAQESLLAIRRCLAKTAPTAAQASFASVSSQITYQS